MACLFTVIAAVLGVVAALPTDLPAPSQFAFILSEDGFEDYLDSWLEIEEAKFRMVTPTDARSSTGCSFSVNGGIGQPQPVFLRNDNYVVPTGTTGQINLNAGEQVIVSCTGSKRILHPNVTTNVFTAPATCENNELVSGDGWLDGNGAFSELTCSAHPSHEAVLTTDTCYNNNRVIRVGYTVEGVFYPLYWSCFDQDRLEVLYVWYEQNPPNAVHQTNVNRPSWSAGSFYPGVNVNTMYTQAQQKTTIATVVGNDLADKYITNLQYLARGHLAAKTDFIYASGQRATFYFINAAPQWQPINAGNWNWLEQNLRTRIGEADYQTVVYSGTFGVTQLRNQNNTLVDIYLYKDANNNPQIPVPLYYYKVVHDASRRIATAFVTINNPYYTETEVQALTFCTDRCLNNTAFNWLKWDQNNIEIGYSFCCTIDEFRRTIPHLPTFSVDGLLS
ncbi:uncharacterized protein LOC110377314 [Helicoverpa armigera]|uniref:uncharacterized protein LOC110377314 n=1 Tax=Helicoverpa armigera TaxID=29058 RepID=UPI003082D42E